MTRCGRRRGAGRLEGVGLGGRAGRLSVRLWRAFSKAHEFKAGAGTAQDLTRVTMAAVYSPGRSFSHSNSVSAKQEYREN